MHRVQVSDLRAAKLKAEQELNRMQTNHAQEVAKLEGDLQAARSELHDKESTITQLNRLLDETKAAVQEHEARAVQLARENQQQHNTRAAAAAAAVDAAMQTDAVGHSTAAGGVALTPTRRASADGSQLAGTSAGRHDDHDEHSLLLRRASSDNATHTGVSQPDGCGADGDNGMAGLGQGGANAGDGSQADGSQGSVSALSKEAWQKALLRLRNMVLMLQTRLGDTQQELTRQQTKCAETERRLGSTLANFMEEKSKLKKLLAAERERADSMAQTIIAFREQSTRLQEELACYQVRVCLCLCLIVFGWERRTERGERTFPPPPPSHRVWPPSSHRSW